MLSATFDRIYLIGLSGVGKTTFGKILAEQLQFPFVDLDSYIAQKSEKDIAAIFAEDGEAFFREAEKNSLYEIAQKAVIATGGGTPCFFDNIDFMKKNGLVIWLNRPPESIASTITVADRPLLQSNEENTVTDTLQRMLKERMPYYFQADIFVNNDQLTADELADILQR